MGAPSPPWTGRPARWLARLRPRSPLRRAAQIALAVAIAPWLLLGVVAALTPLPPELRAAEDRAVSTVLLDRHGTVLRELRAGDGARARWLPLAEAGDRIQRALLAAEDRRFARHPGVDPIAIARAIGQLAAERRVVSGASTITQQLARALVPRPRTARGKLGEMALALRIEASLSKREILEQYLNRVAFGPGLRGVEAASRFYFDKPTADLSLAEAAALASMPRGPALYDPRRGTGPLERRRNRVLDRMLAAGLAGEAEVARARAEPIALAPKGSGLGAPHLVRAVLGGALGDGAVAAPLRGRASEITLTIDRGLQREIEVLAQQTVRGLSDRDVGAAAVVVLENATGEILAYVGSHDIDDVAGLGHNDGVLALRQPGSALKPFVYELAMEQLGFTAATVLPDVELSFPTADGSYVPRNYDGRFHGPVRLRDALASSYNVPAVWTAAALGPDRVLARLRELGLGSLDGEPSRYGVAIALGDGEVRLLDLANAYATLARGGIYMPVRAVRAVTNAPRAVSDEPPAPAPPSSAPPERGARVLDAARARVITDILADDKARLASFGEGSALDLPFPVAAKTGTSKGFRDNLAVGFTPDVTVAVWVGNFDGSPMGGVSGITGAGPLFRDAMLAAARVRPPRPFDAPDPDLLAEVEVCSLSGMTPTAACPHSRRELLPRGDAAALSPCDMHEIVRVDRRNGLRAGACPDAAVEERVFERHDAELTAWARTAGRPIAPDEASPLCGALPGRDGAAQAQVGARVRVAYPPDGARFVLDPSVNSLQAIRLRADVPAGVRRARFVLDGRPIEVGPPFALDWPLVAGAHRLRVEADGASAGEEIAFSVE
ncbi:penicillin-binding protein 1C [Sorangium cellulosum]|uniref:peptidoglycan glycosyltransferase n=1 Tax=Sorangium cellulosum TaxID=56 RepID=A0A150QCU4_SORCE|nr:penicillin-binding protein 1C [Sorangium cellulosum]KYF65753.1 penicillin-binding protein 1C [Sorangium cellulosum]